MSELNDLQHHFTQAIRSLTESEDPQIKRYRDLVYQVHETSLKRCFPVIYSILSEQQWSHLVALFIYKQRSQDPSFFAIPRTFVDFLKTETLPYPFLYELAHYEWVELALAIDPIEVTWFPLKKPSQLLEKIPVISPLAWVLQYQFPVHQIQKDYLPTDKDETFIIAYRDKNDAVLFDKIDASTAYLVQLLQHNKTITGKEALETLAHACPESNRTAMIEAGYQALQDLYHHGIICRTQIT